MNKINRVGIVIKPHAPNVVEVLNDLVSYLQAQGKECVLEEAAAGKIGGQNGIPREMVPDESGLIIVLGGDGTLLSIAHLAARRSIPVMGVNLGRLGFLTEVPVDEMLLTLDAYFKGSREITSRRRMLDVFYRDNIFLCLNDIVINKGALARMIRCEIYINDKRIAIPRLDGIIVSTPTGSTAYSLAAGGPIIQPNMPAVIFAPICPHTLTFRPMVISSDSEIRIKVITEGEKTFLTLDGQRGNKMRKNDEVKIRISDHTLSLISSPKRNYFDLLHEKLGWG
ncbi:MAG: NAD(+)/NADH kinase [Candidatus Aminicenantes bacterium]